VARARIGLDIGSTFVRAAEVSLGGSPSIVRIGQVPLPPGAVERGEVQAPEVVAEAVRELWRQAGFKSREVIMGVGNQRVVVREVALPALPDKELEQSLRFQIQDLIPIPLEDAVIDYDRLDEFEAEGRQMVRLLVVAAQRDMVDHHVASATAARLEPTGVDLIPFALVRSIGEFDGLGLEPSEQGSEAVVDVGAEVTNICVHDRGIPRFVRILPSGGTDVTRAVAASLGIDEEQAEILKQGAPIEDPSQREAARRTLDERAGGLADEIRSSLDFYRAQTPGVRITHVRVSGGGAKMPGFVEMLGERVGVPAELGRPFAKMDVKTGLHEADLAEAEPLVAVAVGLAMPPEEGPT